MCSPLQYGAHMYVFRELEFSSARVQALMTFQKKLLGSWESLLQSASNDWSTFHAAKGPFLTTKIQQKTSYYSLKKPTFPSFFLGSITYNPICLFPKIVVPQNGWFIMETLLKWMISGTTIFGNIHMSTG